MRVRRLELLGFKSFCNKTAVQFESGVTAIVGPNGSGKSNIVDGIRWVLGEHNPRDVRAPRLEDVIFNGTDNKAPLSMAEVSLTIENEQGLLPISFSEVQISRRVYRSGESECFINQSPCRLRDIQELFLGTGLGGGTYAIIEQGHIDMILSSKPDERRVVFEEASGIAKYLSKKQETLRRLDDVEQDLIRVADIAQEVRRQVSALERQASKARQYKTQWEQLKSFELKFAADELKVGEQANVELANHVEQLKEDRKILEEQRQRLVSLLESCNVSVGTVQAKIQDVRTLLVESTSRIEQNSSQKSLKERWISELSSQHEGIIREESQLQARMSIILNQLEHMASSKISLASELERLQIEKSSLAQSLSKLDQSLKSLEQEMEDSKSVLFEAASNASQRRNVLADLSIRFQQAEIQTARLGDQQSSISQRLDELKQRSLKLEQECSVFEEQKKGLNEQLGSAGRSLEEAQNERHQLVGRLNSAKERLLGHRAKTQLLDEVWQRHEGFSESIKTLLANPPEGVIGLLVDVLDAKPGYEHAVESALGELSSSILVRDKQALRRCRQALSDWQLEGARIVVLSECQNQNFSDGFDAASIPPGYQGRISDFLSVDEAYRPLANWLLGNWGVVDDIARLLDWGNASVGHWVSTTGERWDGHSWQLARLSSQMRMGRKRRLETARQELSVLEQEVAGLEEAFRLCDDKFNQIKSQEDGISQSLSSLNPQLTRIEGQLSLTSHEIKKHQEEYQANSLSLQELGSNHKKLALAIEDARKEVEQAEERQKSVDSSIKQLRANHDDSSSQKQRCLVSMAQASSALEAQSERVKEITARLAELESEKLQISSSLDSKKLQAKECEDKIEGLKSQIQEHGLEVERLNKEIAPLQSQVGELGEELKSQESKRNQVMPDLLSVEQELLTKTQELQKQESQLSERSFRRLRIIERLNEVYHLDESQVLAEHPDTILQEEEKQSLYKQIEALKTKLGAMGPVNLGSVEEYDELRKRQDFLQTQQQDLIKSKEDLKQSISQINRTARQQFRETFAKIQQEFQYYFTRLFGGGQADLLLIDEEDVLESGIEIIARPPGKRPQSISLLSGGERALTAIALLFALFKVKPSPFCILDEIDAPLDEANVDRFTRVLEEFLSLSQFILITHNKKTITKADCLYGVTMEQAGISKIVSVKLTRRKAHPAPASSKQAESSEQAAEAVSSS